MSFENQVVIITGAASGIGYATAKLFAKEKANLALLDVNDLKLAAIKPEFDKSRTLLMNTDVRYTDVVDSTVKNIVERFGQIDVLINNTGSASLGSILDGKLLQSFHQTMSNNLQAFVHMTYFVAPYLLKTKGNIVNVSSTAGSSLPKNPDMICHSISKAGIIMFTKAAALELGAYGVRVNSIAPGVVETDYLVNSGMDTTWEELKADSLLGKNSLPEEIADMILYIASYKAKSVTGSNFVIDNGYLLKNA